MGGLIGGILGGIGNYAAANAQARASDRAAQTALTGFNYLNGSAANNQFIDNGAAANNAQSELLGLRPTSGGTTSGFNNYLNSTGYQFNLQQGTDAIASQNAARGLLGSGGTGKALMQYGQGLGSQYFNNYLGQLGGLAGQGQNALQMTGAAGSSGGGQAAQMQSNAGAARGNALGGLWNMAGNVVSGMQNPWDTGGMFAPQSGGSPPQGGGTGRYGPYSI